MSEASGRLRNIIQCQCILCETELQSCRPALAFCIHATRILSVRPSSFTSYWLAALLGRGILGLADVEGSLESVFTCLVRRQVGMRK